MMRFLLVTIPPCNLACGCYLVDMTQSNICETIRGALRIRESLSSDIPKRVAGEVGQRLLNFDADSDPVNGVEQAVIRRLLEPFPSNPPPPLATLPVLPGS